MEGNVMSTIALVEQRREDAARLADSEKEKEDLRSCGEAHTRADWLDTDPQNGMKTALMHVARFGTVSSTYRNPRGSFIWF